MAEGLNGLGGIDSITRDYLHFKETETPRTQQLYFLKKIVKSSIVVRPICSGPTERISQLVDTYLQPHVPKIGHLSNYLKPRPYRRTAY